MKYKSYCQVFDMNGQFYWVNANPSGLYTGMLKSIIGQLEAMLSHYSRVHVLRFDLRQYEYTQTNQRISKFNRSYFKWLKRHYGFIRIGFAWAREQESAPQQHYHYVLMIDGHKVCHPAQIYKKAKQLWEDMDGSIFLPENPFTNVIRGDFETVQRAIYRISYLAKTRSKGNSAKQTHDYGASRIKLN